MDLALEPREPITDYQDYPGDKLLWLGIGGGVELLILGLDLRPNGVGKYQLMSVGSEGMQFGGQWITIRAYGKRKQPLGYECQIKLPRKRYDRYEASVKYRELMSYVPAR